MTMYIFFYTLVKVFSMKNIENNFPSAYASAILHLPTIGHIFLLGALFFPTVHKICSVFIEAEGGGPKPLYPPDKVWYRSVGRLGSLWGGEGEGGYP